MNGTERDENSRRLERTPLMQRSPSPVPRWHAALVYTMMTHGISISRILSLKNYNQKAGKGHQPLPAINRQWVNWKHLLEKGTTSFPVAVTVRTCQHWKAFSLCQTYMLWWSNTISSHNCLAFSMIWAYGKGLPMFYVSKSNQKLAILFQVTCSLMMKAVVWFEFTTIPNIQIY